MDTTLEEAAALKEVTEEISRKANQFLGVAIYPDAVKEGELACIVLWLPSFVKKTITIEKIKRLKEFHPAEGCFESLMDNNDGGPCFIFKIRPRSSRDIMESVYAIRGLAAWTLSVNVTPMMLPPADVETLILQIMGAAKRLPAQLLH